jgi:hypothetical protein
MPASRVLLVLQEGQQLVVDVPGAFLLRPVPAVGEQDDAAQVRYGRLHRFELSEQQRRVPPPADEQGRLPQAGRPDLRVLGALTATAETRREALAKLLPSTKIASKVELGERFLRVFGTRRTYKVHLGSGNILMDPNDAYLCVVPARDRMTPRLHLPFDEDPMLSVILSKAFLLAADDKITDPSIVRQLDR